jgi:hypothetical protein
MPPHTDADGTESLPNFQGECIVKRILAAAAGLILPSLFTVANAAPAMADCPGDTFCLYESSGYNDAEWALTHVDDCRNLIGDANNNANAMRNYTDYSIKLWDLPGCAGTLTYTANAQSYDSNFHNNGFTDKASSLQWF